MKGLLFLFVCYFSLIFGNNLLAGENKLIVPNELKKIAGLSTESRGEFILKKLEKDWKKKQFESKAAWIYFLKKLDQQYVNNKTDLASEIHSKIGILLYQEQEYELAYYFFYLTLREEKNLNSADKPFLAQFHEYIGLLYYYFQRFSLAEEHLLISLNHPFTKENDKINILNTLGLNNRNINNQRAEFYTRKALDLAIKLNHEPWIGVLSGNLGYLLFQKKEYKIARELINRDFTISLKTNQNASALGALSILIDINLIENKINEAKKDIQTFEQLVHLHPEKSILYDYYKVKTKFYEKTGNFKQAYAFYKKFIHVKDQIDKSKDLLTMKNSEFQIDFEKTQAEVLLLQEKKKKDDLKIFSLIILILIIGIAGLIIIRQIQRQRKKDREILELKTNKIQEELLTTEKELRNILEKMADKNKIILQLGEEIEKHQHAVNSEEKEALLNKLQSFSLLTENDWQEFKRLFEKYNSRFFDFFADNYPEVSTAEVRLAALIKLNLSTIEMAKTLGISPDSVRKTNLRLRKKLTIEHQEELIKFIKSL